MRNILGNSFCLHSKTNKSQAIQYCVYNERVRGDMATQYEARNTSKYEQTKKQ